MDYNICFDKVRRFHEQFNHPIGDGKSPIPRERLVNRCKWMREEVDEFLVAETLADQADALVDYIYFGFGNLVELNAKIPEPIAAWSEAGTHELMQVMVANTMAEEARKSVAGALFDLVDQIEMAGSDYEEQFSSSAAAVVSAHFVQYALGIKLAPIFDIVHQANMGKVWPDGSVRYNEDGKTVKPDNWERDFKPEPLIEKEIERQIASQLNCADNAA